METRNTPQLSRLTDPLCLIKALQDYDDREPAEFFRWWWYRDGTDPTKIRRFAASTKFPLYYKQGNSPYYPSKAIVAVAYWYQHGELLCHFSGGQQTVVSKINSLASLLDPNQHLVTFMQPDISKPTLHEDFMKISGDLESDPAFDLNKIEDSRHRDFALITFRHGQSSFRREVINAYGGKCAVTGYDLEAALEACHIHPYLGSDTNHVTNGLLLRSDIHTLFDLGMIAVDTSDMSLILGNDLMQSSYAAISGQFLTLPHDPSKRPDQSALDQHRIEAGL
jgi:hypothetical protein